MNIAQFLNPSSIAIYGVSEDPKKLGSQIYFNITHNNFKGQVFPINPKYSQVHNVACYKNLGEIVKIYKKNVDLAIIVTPAQTIPQILEEVGINGTRNVVIISAGFKEIGKLGVELENEILELKSKYHLNILGPNCLGFINNANNLNATFSSVQPNFGNIGFISQSGAIGTSFMDVCDERGLGLSHFISLGNKVDINENDCLEFLLNDDSTQVIAMYLENFSEGLKFIEIIKNYQVSNPNNQATKKIKPIVLIHPGSSEKAKSAINSHTGSISGSWDIIEAALQKFGVITVSNIEMLVNVVTLLSWNIENNSVKNYNNSYTILTNAGGPGIVLTDSLSNFGIQLDKLSDTLIYKLASIKILQDKDCSFKNPIDIVGDAKVDRYEAVLTELLNSNEVKSVIILLTPQSSTEIIETAKLIVDLKKNYNDKLLIPLFSGGSHIKQAREHFYKNKIMNFKYDDDIVDTLLALKSWNKLDESISQYSNNFKNESDLRLNINNQVLKEGILDESEVIKLCEEYKLTIPRTFLVNTFDNLKVIIDQIDFPVILKATSKDTLHKTEENLVITNVIKKESLFEKFDELQRKIRKIKIIEQNRLGNFVTDMDNYFPDILIQQMLPKSLELFIGIIRDGDMNVYKNKNGFGHLIVFGTGGIFAEIYNDFAKTLLPMSKNDIKILISKTKVGKILSGARGKTFAIEYLIDLILHLQDLILNHPEISELDINPIMIGEKYAKIVDMKVIVKY